MLGIGADCQTIDAERVAILVIFHNLTFTLRVGELQLREHKSVVHNLRRSELTPGALLDFE